MVTIYALKDNGIIFYIGQTTDIRDRMYNHKSSARYKKTIKAKRINDMLINGRELTHEILEICETVKGLKREYYYINLFTKKGINLLNRKPKIIPSMRKESDKLNGNKIKLLQFLADDFTNAEIAKKTSKSIRTIEGNIGKIKKSLKVKHLAALIRVAYNKGIVK